MRPVLRVGWYRFLTTFARRWAGLSAIVLLIGLLGGLAMGALAGARRTQSSFPAYLASTNPEDLQVPIASFDPSSPSNSGYNAAVVAKIARLPHVKHVATFTVFNPEVVALRVPHATNGDGIVPASRLQPAGEQPATLAGATGGEFSTLNRPFVTRGRLANPRRVDEVVVTQGEARLAGLHVGSVIPIGVFTNTQATSPDCCDAANEPYRRIDLKVVGIVILNENVVEDDVDALGAEYVVLTPAFDRAFRHCCSYFSGALLQLDHGSRDAAAVTAELARVTGQEKADFQSNTVVLAKAERAIKPESIALGVFGAIVALATLLVGAQVISRQIRVDADDRVILRALGAGPAMTVADGLIGVLAAVILGSLLATIIAVVLSPLAPLGPARPVDPHPGIAVDWTVLGFGLVVLIGVLSVIAVFVAYREAPHRAARRVGLTTSRSSRLTGVAASSGASAPAVTGFRFALEPGADRSAVPARSTILGAVLAIGVAIATVTFGASLTTLVSRPALYGWNWDYELLSGYGGQEDLPQQQTATLLHHDPYVAASAGVYFAAVKIDGQRVPVIGATPNAAVAPPLLSGHGLETPSQIVLGAATLADLHKHLGDTVIVSRGPTHTRLRIVGTATMPTIGLSGNAHSTMGAGALALRLVDSRGTQERPTESDPRTQRGADPAPHRRRPTGVAHVAPTHQPHPGELARRCRRSDGGAAPGRDRQLPLPAERPVVPRCSARGMCPLGPGVDARRVGAPPPTRARTPQDPRIHPPPARGRSSPGNRRSPSASASSSAYPSASSSGVRSGSCSLARSMPYPTRRCLRSRSRSSRSAQLCSPTSPLRSLHAEPPGPARQCSSAPGDEPHLPPNAPRTTASGVGTLERRPTSDRVACQSYFTSWTSTLASRSLPVTAPIGRARPRCRKGPAAGSACRRVLRRCRCGTGRRRRQGERLRRRCHRRSSGCGSSHRVRA